MSRMFYKEGLTHRVTVTLAFDRPVSRKQAAEEVRNTLGGVHQCPGDSSDAQSFTAIGFKGAAPAGGLILQEFEHETPQALLNNVQPAFFSRMAATSSRLRIPLSVTTMRSSGI